MGLPIPGDLRAGTKSHSPLSGKRLFCDYRDYFKSLFYTDTAAIRSATRRIATV